MKKDLKIPMCVLSVRVCVSVCMFVSYLGEGRLDSHQEIELPP